MIYVGKPTNMTKKRRLMQLKIYKKRFSQNLKCKSTNKTNNLQIFSALKTQKAGNPVWAPDLFLLMLGDYFLSLRRSRISVRGFSSLLGSGAGAGAASSSFLRLLTSFIV